LSVVRALGLLAGFCYTQFADTYQEANGLLHADRTPKFPLEEIAAATRGHPGHIDQPIGPAASEPQMGDSGSAGALQ
jgi:hypothetical protein